MPGLELRRLAVEMLGEPHEVIARRRPLPSDRGGAAAILGLAAQLLRRVHRVPPAQSDAAPELPLRHYRVMTRWLKAPRPRNDIVRLRRWPSAGTRGDDEETPEREERAAICATRIGGAHQLGIERLEAAALGLL